MNKPIKTIAVEMCIRDSQYGMEFQSFGLVDGEDAYAVHLTAGDGFAAKGFVPVADEAIRQCSVCT